MYMLANSFFQFFCMFFTFLHMTEPMLLRHLDMIFMGNWQMISINYYQKPAFICSYGIILLVKPLSTTSNKQPASRF